MFTIEIIRIYTKKKQLKFKRRLATLVNQFARGVEFFFSVRFYMLKINITMIYFKLKNFFRIFIYKKVSIKILRKNEIMSTYGKLDLLMMTVLVVARHNDMV